MRINQTRDIAVLNDLISRFGQAFMLATETAPRPGKSLPFTKNISAGQAPGRLDDQMPFPARRRPSNMGEMGINFLFADTQYPGQFLCSIFSRG